VLLVTQRASVKKVWPGVWTNSFCGHPAPGELAEDAISRRAVQELGIHNLHDIQCVLPTYRYKTDPYNGVIENEYCPVYVARVSGAATPNPAEVGEYKFMRWDEFKKDMSKHPEMYSFWSREQVSLLDNYIRRYINKNNLHEASGGVTE
jgi:isopentenyl-diphosphate delta-isomerase